MFRKYKFELIEPKTDILKEARAFDIILFNNKTCNIKTLLVKFGSNSGWNHAALVMDVPPFDSDEKSNNEVIQKDCLYLYEYAASGQPISFQKLENKLNKENFNRITLIRFKNAPANTDVENMANARDFVIDDFRKRKGLSANELFDKVDDIPKEYKYNTKNIVHRGLQSSALIVVIMIYIFSVLCFISDSFRYYLLGFLLVIPVISILMFLFEVIYRKTSQETIKTQAICSTYPPGILKSIIYDGINQNCEIKTFENKWLNGTPPSPKNLYSLAQSSEDCIVYTYEKIIK